jgi:hypothetical protein
MFLVFKKNFKTKSMRVIMGTFIPKEPLSLSGTIGTLGRFL